MPTKAISKRTTSAAPSLLSNLAGGINGAPSKGPAPVEPDLVTTGYNALGYLADLRIESDKLREVLFGHSEISGDQSFTGHMSITDQMSMLSSGLAALLGDLRTIRGRISTSETATFANAS